MSTVTFEMEDETIVSAVTEQRTKAHGQTVSQVGTEPVTTVRSAPSAVCVCHSLWCIRDTAESTCHEITHESHKIT